MSDTQQTPSWVADLPEELRTNPTLASFKGNDWKDVGPVLAKSYVESRAMIGKKAYDLPKDDWKPEQWSEWHKALGVPESPDKYGTPPEDLITKAGIDKETLKAAQKRFHELGLTPRQVKGIMDEWYLPTAATGSELKAKQQEQERLESAQKLNDELNQLYGDRKDAKLGLVKAFLSKFGGNELVEWADKTGAGNDPGFVKTLIKAGEVLIEDSARRGQSGSLGSGGVKEEALQAIIELKGNQDFMNKYFGGDKVARAKWDDLHLKAYGQE